jgi:Ca2+-binding RTX toxin-like protein
MANFVNPGAPGVGTTGDDTILYNALPDSIFSPAFDARSGNDSLTVQIPYTSWEDFDATDNYAGSFTATTRLGFDGGIVIVYNVENVEFDGTAYNDRFHVKLGTSTSGESVKMDGGDGDDHLHLDASMLTSDFSFVVSGSSIASSWGSFSNIESFEIHTGSGNDTIVTGGENDSIYTGTGVDNVSAGAGNDYIYSQGTGGTGSRCPGPSRVREGAGNPGGSCESCALNACAYACA